MSSFTSLLTVTKIGPRLWRVEREFTYYVGSENSNEFVTVPVGTTTDFASTPRAVWIILPPDGEYTQAAVLHDFLYKTQQYTRAKSDYIFFEAMSVLGVPWLQRRIMWLAVRSWGWIPWNRHKKSIVANNCGVSPDSYSGGRRCNSGLRYQIL